MRAFRNDLIKNESVIFHGSCQNGDPAKDNGQALGGGQEVT